MRKKPEKTYSSKVLSVVFHGAMLSEKKIVDWYFRLVGFFGLENLSSWMYWCTTKRIPRIHCQWLTSFPPESAYPALLNCWTWQIRIGILDSTGSVLPECSFDAQSFFPIPSTSFRKVEWAGERMNGQVGGATLFVFGLLSISFLSGLCCKIWSLGLVCGVLYGFVKFFDDQFWPFLLNQHIWRSEIAGACNSDLESLYLKAIFDKILECICFAFMSLCFLCFLFRAIRIPSRKPC